MSSSKKYNTYNKNQGHGWAHKLPICGLCFFVFALEKALIPFASAHPCEVIYAKLLLKANNSLHFYHGRFYIPYVPVSGSLKMPIFGVRNVNMTKSRAIAQRIAIASLGFLQADSRPRRIASYT